MVKTGVIIKAIDGFYYIKSGRGVYTCRARGLFRKKGIKPLVGDRVEAEIGNDGEGTVEKVLERRNSLVRPPVANIEKLIIVMSAAYPFPNLLVTDRLCAISETQGIEPVIVINKSDIGDAGRTASVYGKAGFRTAVTCAGDGSGIAEIGSIVKGHISVFTGNTGVGKSSIINLLIPGICRDTGEISKKLGRGRHTTRETQLFELPQGGYIADTPGFSSLETERSAKLNSENLAYLFREFRPYIGKCRYGDCAHVKEEGCAVIEAVKNGVIPKSRHESYCKIYSELKEAEKWRTEK